MQERRHDYNLRRQRTVREPDIALTEEERQLFPQAENASRPDDYQAEIQRGQIACSLVKSLLARNAIPKARIDYFWSPACYIGSRGRSHAGDFAANGKDTDETFRHPHFVKCLTYFVCGPDLPQPVISQFREAIEDCGGVTSGDLKPLSTLARQLTRQHRLDPREAAEEFHKLAIECGLSPDFYARYIRDAVRTVR